MQSGERFVAEDDRKWKGGSDSKDPKAYQLLTTISKKDVKKEEQRQFGCTGKSNSIYFHLHRWTKETVY